MIFSPENMPLEDFDQLLAGDIVQAEANLRALLPRAKIENRSIYLQILSQIALTEAVQKKFAEAHKTLDLAEEKLSLEDRLAHVRILLERGRVFWQEGKVEEARPLFLRSFELGVDYGFDEHTVNAAHMVPFVAHSAKEKIEWNQRAVDMAENSESAGAKKWLGSLHNNLGQAFLEDKQYESAYNALAAALEYRRKEGDEPNIRVAKWAVARALRFLGRREEAQSILLALEQEYETMAGSGQFDFPKEMLPSSRGLVYEELAELGGERAREYAKMAVSDLAQDEWFCRLEPGRLERLKCIARGEQ